MNKSQLNEICPKGYSYSGQWDDLYHFTKGNYSDGFITVSCNESDLTNGNLEIMGKKQLTRAKRHFNPK